MPRIISRYSERPASCQVQPDGQTMPSGHRPKVKVSPTSTRAMRRYLMRSASVILFSSTSSVTHFRNRLSRVRWKTRVLEALLALDDHLEILARGRHRTVGRAVEPSAEADHAPPHHSHPPHISHPSPLPP